VLPAGAGTVNQKGLDYYRRLIDALRAKGITPLATLWHWDTPQALQDRGGWESRDTARRFADYAAIVYDALGDDVPTWLTVNEPKTVVDVGYRYGSHAPGLRDPDAAARVLHHLLLGHGLAVQAYRASGLKGRIGPVLNLAPCYPADDSAAAKAAALLQDARENRLYLDPVFTGRYPKDAPGAMAWPALAAVLKPGDLAVISSAVDLLAVNYYNPVFVDAAGATTHRYPVAEPADWLEIYPPGLFDILTRVHRDYGRPTMMITENGRPTVTEAVDGRYPDTDRITFLRDHFTQVHRAISTGVDVEGFAVWSLLDNFEWAEGYSQRWGMVHVDFTTLRRTPKESATWYADVIRRNAV
jgi:beta-glucosidase